MKILVFSFVILLFAFVCVLEKALEYHRHVKMGKRLNNYFYYDLQPPCHGSFNEHSTVCVYHFLRNTFEPIQHQIDSSCVFTENERTCQFDIIKAYQQWLFSLYFRGSLDRRELCRVESEYFAMKFLKEFLHKHAYASTILGEEKYIENRNGDTDIRYLTEYAITFYKMYYIAVRYIENNPVSKKSVVFHHDSDQIKEYINSGYIK